MSNNDAMNSEIRFLEEVEEKRNEARNDPRNTHSGKVM